MNHAYRHTRDRRQRGPHLRPPVVVEVKVTIKALAFKEADGGYSVVVPELPGCVTVGGVSRCRTIPITHRERRSPNACFR